MTTDNVIPLAVIDMLLMKCLKTLADDLLLKDALSKVGMFPNQERNRSGPKWPLAVIHN
jgi:hypothetical protein